MLLTGQIDEFSVFNRQLSASENQQLYASATSTSPVFGGDYISITGTIVIAAGQSSATLPIRIINDLFAEGSETVIVTLIADAAYQLGATTSGTVTITSNE